VLDLIFGSSYFNTGTQFVPVFSQVGEIELVLSLQGVIPMASSSSPLSLSALNESAANGENTVLVSSKKSFFG